MVFVFVKYVIWVSFIFHFVTSFMCQRLVFYFLFSWLMFLFCFVCGVVQILGKCEFLNPGGSVKDRVAVKIIEEVNYYYL